MTKTCPTSQKDQQLLKTGPAPVKIIVPSPVPQCPAHHLSHQDWHVPNWLVSTAVVYHVTSMGYRNASLCIFDICLCSIFWMNVVFRRTLGLIISQTIAAMEVIVQSFPKKVNEEITQAKHNILYIIGL